MVPGALHSACPFDGLPYDQKQHFPHGVATVDLMFFIPDTRPQQILLPRQTVALHECLPQNKLEVRVNVDHLAFLEIDANEVLDGGIATEPDASKASKSRLPEQFDDARLFPLLKKNVEIGISTHGGAQMLVAFPMTVENCVCLKPSSQIPDNLELPAFPAAGASGSDHRNILCHLARSAVRRP
jgi:hypothetical protein